MNFKDELNKIEEQINIYKEEKIRLEEQGKQLEKERQEILAQLKEEDVTEDTIRDKIHELEIELQEGIAKCQNILKSDS